MSQLAKRLRNAAACAPTFGPLLTEAAEAADEIERLRKEVVAADATIKEQAREIERLKKEVAELRKATGQAWTEVSEGLPPDDGRWYWVDGDGLTGPIPAKRGYYDAGGWSNEDTWQDWGHDVERYCPIPKPPAVEGE